MSKKSSADTLAPAAPAKRTPEEKAQRKADKAGRRATKSLNQDHAEKKASQKQTLKAAAKQLQKELDARMSEVVDRIRKETKAKLKEVVKEATRRLDVDTERMFEQALHTIVRHYDSIAPGRTTDINLPAPTPSDAAATAPAGPTSGKNGAPRKTRPAEAAPAAEATPAKKRAGRPTGSTSKPTTTGRGPGRPKRQAAPEVATAELSTPVATANDSVAVDNV
ncbi:hypothetical protein [Hymenobacter cheonanensis]|uniref:hypothetical protein n=1 Tax=Hymenobacter sp. CA2-7 TaxID=3063993 RepID=UPI002713BE38|nr:hypothetical protein [Hymenobacter sp. CA2-7]MDO7887412.1 hypothetical protein [Hymenobacter sp. CA2-7]